MTTLGDMTREELIHLIEETLDQRFFLLTSLQPPSVDWKAFEEVRATIKQRRWTPPSDAPTIVELLRENRGN